MTTTQATEYLPTEFPTLTRPSSPGPSGFVIRDEGNRYCPRLRCHNCGKIIMDLEQAWIAFSPFDPDAPPVQHGDFFEIHVLCYGRSCIDPLQYQEWLNDELSTFIFRILFNGGIKTEKELVKRWRHWDSCEKDE